MASRRTLFTDNFTRADENPLSDGGQWSVFVENSSHSLYIASDLCQAVFLNARNASVVSGLTTPNNQWAEITCKAIITAGTTLGVLVRATSGGSTNLAYRFVYGVNTTQYLLSYYALPNTLTTISSTTGNPAASINDRFRLEVFGTTLNVYKNDALIMGPFTDSHVASGKTGATMNTGGGGNNAVSASLFTAGDFVLDTPTFSPIAGTYTSTQSVTISSATDSGLSGFAMYYTTDGTTPTTGSTLYTAPISVAATETIKVIAVATGYSNSDVASAAYTIVLGYNVSGNAGVAGATVSWATGQFELEAGGHFLLENNTGDLVLEAGTDGTVTADGSGNYTIPLLPNGDYTVTPSKTGYSFAPTSRAETVSGADLTGVNFTASQNSSSGQVGAFLVGP